VIRSGMRAGRDRKRFGRPVLTTNPGRKRGQDSASQFSAGDRGSITARSQSKRNRRSTEHGIIDLYPSTNATNEDEPHLAERVHEKCLKTNVPYPLSVDDERELKTPVVEARSRRKSFDVLGSLTAPCSQSALRQELSTWGSPAT